MSVLVRIVNDCYSTAVTQTILYLVQKNIWAHLMLTHSLVALSSSFGEKILPSVLPVLQTNNQVKMKKKITLAKMGFYNDQLSQISEL